MSVLGQLAAEATAWREAWRGRRANPIAQQAALECRRRDARRPAWLPCSRFMFFCTALISSVTAYLLVIAYLRFSAVAGSSIASRSFAHGALLWGGLQVLDSAVVLAILWLAERLALSFWYSGGLLAAYPGARGALGSEMAGSRLSDHEYVMGALQHVLHLCWRPLLVLGGLSALDGFIHQSGWLGAPYGDMLPGWRPEQLPVLALLALLTALLKPICGLLAVWATALVLLSFGPWWRHAAVSYIAAGLTLAWHLPGLLCVLPGTLGQQVTDWMGDALPWMFSEPLILLNLMLLLLVFCVEAHTTSPLRAHQYWMRPGMPAMRLILVSGALVILCFAMGNAYALINGASYGYTDEPGMLSFIFWPVLTVSSANPMSLQTLVSAGAGEAWWQAFAVLGLLGLAQASLTLLLLLIFAGHARAAVYLRRSVLG
jgi:hypothetical protein